MVLCLDYIPSLRVAPVCGFVSGLYTVFKSCPCVWFVSGLYTVFESCPLCMVLCLSRRVPDGSQSALTAVTTQPVAVDCMGVVDTMEPAGAGYCVVTTSLPMATQPHMGGVASSPGAGQGAGGGVVYWMPVVTVPYASSMGQVNLAWAPSQDPYGKDLPLTGTSVWARVLPRVCLPACHLPVCRSFL